MRSILRFEVFVLIATFALCAAPPDSRGQARTPLIQSIDIQIPVSPIPVNIAGKKHLGYELHISNFRKNDVVVTRIRVLDPETETLLADYTDSELNLRIGRPGAGSDLTDKRVIAGGMRAVVYLWIALKNDGVMPNRLKHRIEYDWIRSSDREHGVVETGELNIRNESAVVLDAPLRGGPWVALYDPMMEHGHRTSIYTIQGRARIPARFAIDWIRLDENSLHARGDESKVTNWYGYGAEVSAVADATVAEARDDIDEYELISPSQGTIPLENASGNFVALDLGNARYAFYEHLKHGSVKVKTGDRVRRGQVIAQLGNSGSSSSGPHLHFHVSDANSTLAAEGLPFVFRNFEVLGAFQSIDAFAKGDRWTSAAKDANGTRSMELPAPNVVVMFQPN